MKDKSGTATSKELSLWKRRFKIFFYGTPLTVTGFFIAQICATKGSFSTEFSSLENWKTFTETFNLPIGVFTAMAAITTLIGMYYRSLQLAHQLNKVEDQIEIANKQFSKSSEQFELASRKENFVLFLEHRKAVRELVELHIEALIPMQKRFLKEHDHVSGIIVNYQVLYEKLFPENTVKEMKEFNFKTKNGKSNFLINELKIILLQLHNQQAITLDYKSIEPILAIFSKVGFNFQVTCYSIEGIEHGGIWLASFFLDASSAVVALYDLGVIDLDEYKSITVSMQELANQIRNSHILV
ncbi:hypothetical protein NQU96_04480 [Pseudoalteromonas elyakovii]|nr:hypothetical protein [Pseudoalteromonas elyakovii]